MARDAGRALRLRKETLTTLTGDELAGVAGATADLLSRHSLCYSCFGMCIQP